MLDSIREKRDLLLADGQNPEALPSSGEKRFRPMLYLQNMISTLARDEDFGLVERSGVEMTGLFWHSEQKILLQEQRKVQKKGLELIPNSEGEFCVCLSVAGRKGLVLA